MLRFESTKGVETCAGMTRRDFLRVGSVAAGAVGLSLTDLTQLQRAGAGQPKDVNCILLFLIGGPSQLETWDMKPDAPQEVRGPFRPVRTNVPGIEICEHFRFMPQMADQFAIVRSVHHQEAPIHETGQQMMQTGHLFRGGREHPHYGAVLSHLRGRRVDGMPPFVLLPAPVGNTGVSVSHGQTAGYLGSAHEPLTLAPELVLSGTNPESASCLLQAVDAAQHCFESAPDYHKPDDAHAESFNVVFSPRAKKAFAVDDENLSTRARYGGHTFGRSCLLARRLVEHGVRLVTVNMFDTVFNQVTWDCHADGGALPTTLDDYRTTLCPMFDQAYTALLQDLHDRDMLQNTLVVAMGEFGRTPHLNPRGGRDHWPGCWSILFAGAGVRGGQVIGVSDKIAAEPKDRPVTPAEVAASVYYGLGIDPNTLLPGPEGQALPLVDARPIRELFGS
jgi:uncharacterized protein (DUF1501 family)